VLLTINDSNDVRHCVVHRAVGSANFVKTTTTKTTTTITTTTTTTTTTAATTS